MTNYFSNGYRCSVCGVWVTSGFNHVCGGSVSYSQPLPLQPDAVAMALGRIEALLQQILRKLETTP